MLLKESRAYRGSSSLAYEHARKVLGAEAFAFDSIEDGALTFHGGLGSWSACFSLALKHEEGELRAEANCASAGCWVLIMVPIFAVLIPALVQKVSLSVGQASLGCIAVALAFATCATLCERVSKRSLLTKTMDALIASLNRAAGEGGSLLLSPAPHSARQRCAYCHLEAAQAPLPRCPGCGVALHPECWGEIGSCPSLGCRGARERPRRASVKGAPLRSRGDRI